MSRVHFAALLFAAILDVRAEEQVVDLWEKTYTLNELLEVVERDFHRDSSWAVNEIPSFESAHSAGAKLLDLFKRPPVEETDLEWETKCAIAACFGMIQYRPAIPSLIEALEEETNWRLVLLSAWSLGQMHSVAALPKLEELEWSHWYPPVCESASLARKVILNQASYLPSSFSYHPNPNTMAGRTPESVHLHRLINFGFAWGDRMPPSEEENQRMVGKRIREGSRGEPRYRLGPDAVRQPFLSFSVYRNKLGADKRRFQRGFRIPDCGLYYRGGVLLGKDDGEFGGELLFLREFSQPQYLLRWPIAAIHRIGERVLVIPGRGHGVSQTMVFEVVSNESETPTLRRWKVLPGGHHGSGLNDRGELELSFNLGNFIVSQDGDIRMATD